MIIVAGHLRVKPERRTAFLTASYRAVEQARSAPGCHDFVVSADPLEADRVNVYERWQSEADLEAFRGAGPGDDLSADIVDAQVLRHEIASTGPA